MEWNLTDIFKSIEEYENIKNDLIKKLDEIEQFKGKLCDSAQNLYNCYKLYEEALEKNEKIYAYGMLKYHLDMSNQESIKLFKDAENIETLFNIKTSFISPEITYADEEKIKHYIKSMPELKPYKRDIMYTLEQKKHTLSQEAEDILAKYSEILSAPKNTYDILTNAEFKFGTLINEKGEEIELTESNYSTFLKSKEQRIRKTSYDLICQKYSEYINTIAELYLANVKTNVITSKLRNYNSSLEKAVIHDEGSIKVYNSLIEAINENITSNHEFLELKKKLLNLKKMYMYDLYINPFENEEKITFEEAKSEVLNSLSILGTEYTDMLKVAFENNWIDVNAKPNKRGGAYNMGVYGVHPFILMNFENSKRDISDLAHELGHSMHSYYADSNQNIINSSYTIMVAEVASTVNELLLAHYQIEKEKNNKKKAEILYELLEMIKATLFTQSMFAEFEKEVHEREENGEVLSSEDISYIYDKINRKYSGKSVEITEQAKNGWARIPHFYTDFYVYKYATGISAAIVISENIIKQGENYVKRYIEMLKQGCSKKSIELLKMVDVDLESKQTYINAIKFYKEKVEELKTLI